MMAEDGIRVVNNEEQVRGSLIDGWVIRGQKARVVIARYGTHKSTIW
jgi:hypothetical protein